jgi:catechol 2,3-dioxygenase-like lactoylglutathione lyase family enzyme
MAITVSAMFIPVHDPDAALGFYHDTLGLEVRTRIDAELTGQGVTGAGQRPERIPLTPTPVLPQGQDRPPPLAQRLRCDEGLGLRHHLSVLTGRQSAVQPVLLRRALKLLQPGGLALARQPPVELLERPAPPQRQRPGVRGRRSVDLTRGPQHAAPVDELLEPVTIDVVAVQRQSVSARDGLDRRCAEHLAQSPDADLHLLGPRRRRSLAPQCVRELVGRHHVAPTNGQDAQGDPVAGLERLAAVHRQGPEKADPAHRSGVSTREQPAVNGANTGSIPVGSVRPYQTSTSSSPTANTEETP